VGLRRLSSVAAGAKKDKGKASLPAFKQYREADGLFYFKFVDAQGRLLLQSAGFASPREAGQFIAALKAAQSLPQDGKAAPAEGVSPEQVEAALKELADSANQGVST
jgi:tryptophanyl-tRNA synthetase